MKLKLKSLFGSRKTRNVSGTDPVSSNSDTSSPDTSQNFISTPKTVLPTKSPYHSHNHSVTVSADISVKTHWDSKLSRHEFELVLHRLGFEPPTEDELASIFNEADGDGCITLEELGSGAGLGSACDSDLREAFEFFDADRDGKISAEELLGVFSTIGDEGCTLDDCRRMIVGVDSDGDGLVSFEDFTRMMERGR